MCLYTHNDPTQLLTCNGVREWTNQTNAARLVAGASDNELITVEQDWLWDINPTAVDQDLYRATIDQCPDHVDVLWVCGQTTEADAVAVSAALAAS